MNILVVSCYHDVDYVRAQTLREGVKKIPGVRMVPVRNTRTGLLRYPEVLRKLYWAKKEHKPSAIVLTFRGQEILPLVLLIARKTPVIFDEFIVPIAYATHEKHARSFKTSLYHTMARVGTPLYNFCLKQCSTILADTKAHAELGARAGHSNLSKYLAVPVGTNESLFKPKASRTVDKASKKETFDFFFYGTMQPLHGIDVLLHAAENLKDKPNIRFVIAGATGHFKKAVTKAQKNGANITLLPWVPFKELPDLMRSADVVLGGPFGGTRQAHHVVTTKTYQGLACQKLVIIGESQATNEHFVHRHNALIVPQKDAESLARTCVWAYEHQSECKEIAARGRKLFEKSFSTDAIGIILSPLADRLRK